MNLAKRITLRTIPAVLAGLAAISVAVIPAAAQAAPAAQRPNPTQILGSHHPAAASLTAAVPRGMLGPGLDEF